MTPSGAPQFTSLFSGVCVVRSLVFVLCFADHCSSPYPFFVHCIDILSFDLRLLIIPFGTIKLSQLLHYTVWYIESLLCVQSLVAYEKMNC